MDVIERDEQVNENYLDPVGFVTSIVPLSVNTEAEIDTKKPEEEIEEVFTMIFKEENAQSNLAPVLEERLSSLVDKYAKRNEGKLRRLQFEEKSHILNRKVIFVLASFIIVIANAILRGKHPKSLLGVRACSWLDWLIFALVNLGLVGIAFMSIQFLKNEYQKKVRVGYAFHKADV